MSVFVNEGQISLVAVISLELKSQAINAGDLKRSLSRESAIGLGIKLQFIKLETIGTLPLEGKGICECGSCFEIVIRGAGQVL